MLAFASIALYLLYVAYRYELLYVFNVSIDTKGLVYPRALQQITTGVYLALVCQLGLFGIQAAIGPIVLTVIFIIFIALFHISLNAAIDPLLLYLPKSLEMEEDSLLELENGETGNGTKNGTKETQITTKASNETGSGHDLLPPAPHKKPNIITKWLRPDIYTDYETLRRLVPRGFAEIEYSEEIERHAYYHPSIASPTPLLWIPRDTMGVSQQECRHTSKVIPITDEQANFDEKNNIVWNQEDARPPIYEEKIYY